MTAPGLPPPATLYGEPTNQPLHRIFRDGRDANTLPREEIRAPCEYKQAEENKEADDGNTPQQIAADEMKNIASLVTGEQAAIDKAFAEGLHIAGERYVLAKAEEGSVYARKV